MENHHFQWVNQLFQWPFSKIDLVMSWGIHSRHHGLNYWNCPNIYSNRGMTWRILGVSPHFRKVDVGINESIDRDILYLVGINESIVYRFLWLYLDIQMNQFIVMSRAGIGTNRQVSVAGQLEVPVSPDLAVEVSQEFEMISGSGYTIKLATGWGPRWIAFSCFINLYKWLNSMFYGRYNELVFMVVTICYNPICSMYGIFTYKTGWFWALANVGQYSSTMVR